MVNGAKAKGQSLSELLVSLAVIAPLFILVPVMANYLDIQTATHEASRYVAWERTAYRDMSDMPDDVETLVQERFVRRESGGFSLAQAGDDDKRWKDFGRNGLPSLVDRTSNSAVSSGTLAMNINDPVSNSNINAIEAMDSDALGVTAVSIPLDADGSLLATFSAGSDFLHRDRSSISTPNDEVSGGARFHTKASAVLLADGGAVPVNEEAYTDITNTIVSTDGSRIDGWQGPLKLFNVITLGFFEEIDILESDNDGKQAVSEEQSLILPEGLVEYQP